MIFNTVKLRHTEDFMFLFYEISADKSEILFTDDISYKVNGEARTEVMTFFCESFNKRVCDTGMFKYIENDDFQVFIKPFTYLVEAKLDNNPTKARIGQYKGMFTLALNTFCRTLRAREPEKTTLPSGVFNEVWLKEQETKSKEVANDLDTDFSEFEEPVLNDDNIPVLNDVKDDFEFEQDFFEDPVFEETKTKQDFSKLSVRNDILESRKESIEQKQSAAEIIFSTEYEEEFSRYYKFSIALIGDDYEAYTELHKEIEVLIKTKYLYKVKKYQAIAELERQGKSIEEIQNFLDMLDEYNKIIGK